MSMENLEDVVRERNKAFHQLEVGVSGERERIHRFTTFSLKTYPDPDPGPGYDSGPDPDPDPQAGLEWTNCALFSSGTRYT